GDAGADGGGVRDDRESRCLGAAAPRRADPGREASAAAEAPCPQAHGCGAAERDAPERRPRGDGHAGRRPRVQGGREDGNGAEARCARRLFERPVRRVVRRHGSGVETATRRARDGRRAARRDLGRRRRCAGLRADRGVRPAVPRGAAGCSGRGASAWHRIGPTIGTALVPSSGTERYDDLVPMLTDVNPFVYSHPIAPDDVIDRDDETKQLLGAAVGGHYVRLYAPRKYGKTSLLRRVLRDGERDEGLIPILVDLYGVLSIADVSIRFERAYARQLKGKIRARVEEFLQSTGLGLSLGALGISARLQLDPRSDPLPALHALLDLPLRLEESGGFRALIVLDEFQDVTKVKEMDALLRSHIQFQGEVASFVFAGSEPGLMRELFENKERPLY